MSEPTLLHTEDHPYEAEHLAAALAAVLVAAARGGYVVDLPMG